MIRLLKYSMFVAVLLSCEVVCAQRHDDPVGTRERGMTLYQQGKDNEAIKVLEGFLKQYSLDARAWHYLGLAQSRRGNEKKARQAHEAAVLYAIDLTKEYLEGRSPDIMCVMVNPLRTMLIEATESANAYLALSEKPSASTVAEWNERAEWLRQFLKSCPESTNTDDQQSAAAESGKPPDATRVSARIISKPNPEYTEKARLHNTKGTVVIVMMFSDDGIVKGIVPLVSLPNGLTGEAIKAAQKIRFTPATKNGKAVPQFIKIEYNFDIY